MDKDTRSAIERATQRARKLLEDDFASQLEGTFDVMRAGIVAPKPGSHLSPRQAFQRDKIVAAIEHKRAAGISPADAVADYLRDAAFTTLNRFVALKMLETRELVQECITKGDKSAGYREFCGLAPGVALLPDSAGYRLYIESLFDEISVDLKVLFNRRDAVSVLWPRRACFEELLRALNVPDLAAVWGEDETIGWVYQYYNSNDERKAMREESAAPRNSRELAVRNQFFTPRYVVEFLTDNTLGRLWYEMTRGQTVLRDSCRYLARRPTEIFLKPGESAPESAAGSEAGAGDNLSQEELLRHPVYIPHRPLKDPREIRLLDPACGSMHFGLYALDLCTVIYDEAWEVAHGSDDEKSAEAFAPFVAFAATFPDKDAFLREVPRLIVERNIHGIDIDPRAAQIAGLSLWLRAQRAWHEAGVKPADRPCITRSNLVCAEPMPGEKELLREFVEQQFPAGERPAFAFLLDKIFDCMTLAGEVGSLLRIEEEVGTAIADAKRRWKEGPKAEQTTMFSEAGEQAGQGEMRLDLSGITDELFWERAEQRIYDALKAYAEQAENDNGFQRRLFADDAAQGFAFIDLCRKRYDVTVMNPPFGKCSQGGTAYFERAYADFKSDIGIAFVDRFTRLANESGCVGAITSRAFLASDSLNGWRKERLLERTPLHSLLDLGYGVLDDAMVEVAAYVVDANSAVRAPRAFVRALECRDKQQAVTEFFQKKETKNDLLCFLHDLADFRTVPLAVICYWLPASLLHKLQQLPALPESGGAARHGLVTTDDWQFLRVTWEIAPESMRDGAVRRWKLLAKGGEYQPFWDDIHICVDWSGDGQYLKTFLAEKRLKTQGSADWTPWLNHSEYYGLEGLTYPERTTSDFCPRVLPSDVIFSSTGQAIQFNRSREAAFAYLCGSFTRFFRLVVESFVGSGDNAFPGSAAKHYRSGLLNQLPAPLTDGSGQVERIAVNGVQFAKRVFAADETARNFCPRAREDSLHQMCLAAQAAFLDAAVELISQNVEIESLIATRFSLGDIERAVLNEIIGPHPASYIGSNSVDSGEITELWKKPVHDVVEFCIQRDGPRRQLTKKSFIADRKLELVCHGLKLPPRLVVEAINSAACLDDETVRVAATSELSFAVGTVFGRWDIRYATGERSAPELADAFAPLPVCPPGMLQGENGLPLSPEAGRQLRAEGRYPLDVAWDGILVDDPEHPFDLERRVHAALAVLWGDRADAVEHEACALLGVPTLREWFRRPAGFFADHLKRYSKSRRQAPIYWPLSTPSGSYTLWLHYHRLYKDTFYRCLELVKEKLQHEEARRERLTAEAGASPDSRQRKELGAQEIVVGDIRAFHEEMARVAPLWKPNFNDGVIINYAPLWRLIAYKPWQKAVKSCWDELVSGDYDWAYLAMHLWPERVVPKCAKDRSLAIAHGLEDVFWVEATDGKWRARKTPTRTFDDLVRERTSPAVKAALKSLLEAPVAQGGGGRGRGGRSRSAASVDEGSR